MPHFLIVDDDAAVGRTLTRMLELDGHRVTAVQSGESALKCAVADRPDALLVDIRMPTMSGIDFLRHVRQDTRLRDIPVALLTGDYFLDDALLTEIHALGATVRYKPLWLEDISALAKTLVGKTA